MSTGQIEGAPARRGAAKRLHTSVPQLMRQSRIMRSALKVSLVVGTVRNLIYNGEQLWTQHTLSLWQAMLNYVVPFCVSGYSAARNQAQRARED